MDALSPVVIELRLLRQAVVEMRDEHRYVLRMLLSSDDRRAGRILLPLAAELVGAAPFTADGLLTVAMNDRTATGEAMREVLADMVTDSGGLRAFGRLLARLENVPLAGCRLQAAGEAAGVRRWRLSGVSEDE